VEWSKSRLGIRVIILEMFVGLLVAKKCQ